MGSLSPHEACLRLANDLEHHWSSDEDLNRSHKKLIASLRCACKDGNDETSQIWALMPALAHHTWDVLKDGQPADFKIALLSTLADTTREVPFWRPLFGVAARPDYTANMKQRQWMNPPDSILELARRVIAGIIKGSSSQTIRSALRIIANCCADNNINRSIMINRDGIEDLLEELLRKQRECDLVIPVLYNVCIDYDEPALDSSRRPWPHLPQAQALGDKDYSGTTLNAAELRLGWYYFVYDFKTTYEILLDAWDQAPGCAGTIADLIEIGSRVALLGAEYLVQENAGMDPWDRASVDTAPAILQLLLTKGVELAQVDTDCRISMCQALLNLLSQAEIQALVIKTKGLLWSLIHLPYPEDYDDLPDEEKQALQVYQKAFLKLVYEISGTDGYAQNMTDQVSARPSHEATDKSGLIKNYLLSLPSHSLDIPLTPLPPRLLASIYVLIGNSITTYESAISFFRHINIMGDFCRRFATISDPEVLLPALSVAVRVAMSSEGQECLQKIFPDVARHLSPGPTSEVDATGTEIHRNACHLLRLLLKGRTSSVYQMVNRPFGSPVPSVDPHDHGHARPMHDALSLFSRTKDAQTKLEIGRLSIEVLRRLATWETGLEISGVPGTPEEIFNSVFGTETPPPTVTVADTISFILAQTQPQSQPQSQSPSPSPSPSQSAAPDLQLEGEAWFGVGLLSTYASSHASIRAALARDEYKLLNHLREIVVQNSASASTPPSTAAISSTTDTAANASQEMTLSRPRKQPKDPRYENIKVLLVRMMQSQSTMDAQLESLRLTGPGISDSDAATVEEERVVQEGLEAAAAEMGLDWVLV